MDDYFQSIYHCFVKKAVLVVQRHANIGHFSCFDRSGGHTHILP